MLIRASIGGMTGAGKKVKSAMQKPHNCGEATWLVQVYQLLGIFAF
jgi:hypothetical protein